MLNTLTVRTTVREQMIDITDEVQACLHKAHAREGIVVLYVQHTTAGLTINENADPDVKTDLLAALRKLIPQRGLEGLEFQHAEGNSDAHLKASFFGSSVTVPFAEGKLMLGRWQGIYFCEFDGARTRRVVMSIVKNGE